MEKVRVIPAPRQDDSRVVVLGVILAPDRVTVHAVVESNSKEIEGEFWEDDQMDMFSLADDLGTEYRSGSGAGRSAAGGYYQQDLHVWDWDFYFEPAVPEGATRLTVSHIDGSVEIAL